MRRRVEIEPEPSAVPENDASGPKDARDTSKTEPKNYKPAPEQMKSHVIRGILQVGIASVVMRGGGLVAQIVAGYVLTKGDFGLFAITLGFSTFSVSTLSALRPLFIERITKGEEPDRLWRLILYLMIAIAAVMIIGSSAIASWLGQPEARPLLIVIAPTLPLQFAMVIGIGRLAAELRFSESSKILTASSMARHGSLIVFALLGFGAYALVIPLYVETLLEGTLLWRATGKPPPIFGKISGVLKRYGRTLPWLMLTAVALGVSLSGDYVAISPFETKEVVGLYFFGYSLSAALTQPFTMAATNVLVPSFASITDRERLRSSYLDAISLLLLATGMAFGGLALVGGTLVDFIWSGTWNDAIVAMVLISAGTPFRILQPTCYSLLQARGYWSTHSLLATANATVAVAAAITGAKLGGLFEISLFVGLSGGFVGIAVAVIAGLKIEIAPMKSAAALVKGAIPPVAGAVAAYAYIPHLVPTLGSSILRAVLFLVISLPLSFLLFRESFAVVINSVRGK